MNASPQPPIARATDPATSHEAAADITASGLRASQCSRVLQAVEATPGRTSAELAQEQGINRYVVARRLPEIEAARRIHRGEIRTCAVSGRRATTWWPGECRKQGELF
jgi:hypothetical protein